MKNFIERNWQTILMLGIAAVILIIEYNAASKIYRWDSVAITNTWFVAMGKWGIRFLLLSLAITPLLYLTGWKPLQRWRKPAGLIAFAFVSVHVGIHMVDVYQGWSFAPNGDIQRDFLTRLIKPDFVLFGWGAFTILALMALTSFKPAMKLLGKYWKRLHQLVYVAVGLMLYHSITAATSGKRAGMGGQESADELKIYLGIFVVLMVLRVPIVKRTLQRLSPFVPNPRKAKPKRTVLTA